jgi:undecaprenyl-diphosphatase
MSIFESIILGLVQGFTEFVPVSSSGHLIVVRDLLNIAPSGIDLAVDAFFQLASALALLVYFRLRLLELIKGKDKAFLLAIVLGTIPAVFAGLFLETYMETIFRNSTLVILMLIAGGLLMLFAEGVSTQTKSLTPKKGFLIGLFQCLALVPGVSRSGATISGGLFMGLNREQATTFAFILAIPILLGAGLKKFAELLGDGLSPAGWGVVSIGGIVSFAASLAAIHFLLLFVRNRTLYPFVVYRFVLAALLFFLL